jgi:SAM-dependent methyltransferase
MQKWTLSSPPDLIFLSSKRMTKSLYDDAFYRKQSTQSYTSASVVVPFLLQMINVRSVCDVGCGIGTWLRAFQDHGVSDVLGFDGEYVYPQLQISAADFQAADLTQALECPRRFDLAISLEVAEHLPSRCAATFVKNIGSLADVVLFSAAIPGQWGVGHINTQWQSYWVDLFANEGFIALDVIRPAIWNNDAVSWPYKQNSLLYVRAHRLNEQLEGHVLVNADIVHPQGYLAREDIDQLGFVGALRALPRLAHAAITRRVKFGSDRANYVRNAL